MPPGVPLNEWSDHELLVAVKTDLDSVKGALFGPGGLVVAHSALGQELRDHKAEPHTLDGVQQNGKITAGAVLTALGSLVISLWSALQSLQRN